MKNDILKNNLETGSAPIFPMPRHTYMPNMGTLSQTIPRGWLYLGHLVRNLYMFVDDRTFCEEFFWKLCKKINFIIFIADSKYKRAPCQRIPFFEYFFTFFYFFEKMVKMAPCLFIEIESLSMFMCCTRWYGCHF